MSRPAQPPARLHLTAAKRRHEGIGRRTVYPPLPPVNGQSAIPLTGGNIGRAGLFEDLAVNDDRAVDGGGLQRQVDVRLRNAAVTFGGEEPAKSRTCTPVGRDGSSTSRPMGAGSIVLPSARWMAAAAFPAGWAMGSTVVGGVVASTGSGATASRARAPAARTAAAAE
ncbi:hypothetical protein [Micromonospora chersina]|uniref:hypothetical protein n=1 Tax=Micromonospora chersina TaxID=47854 RepID=UPI0033B167C5